MNIHGHQLKPDTIIEKTYQIISLVNSGAQACVYKARHLKTEETVAIKLITHHSDNFSENSIRLAHEFQSLNTLKGFDLFLTPIQFRQTEKYAYLSMKWIADVIDGEMFIKQNTPMEWKTWLWIAKILTQALDACHKKGIIHRDIKPQNILFAPNGVIKVIDFGIAQQDSVIQVTENDMNAGTISYMPPEQILEGEYGIPGEMYALGITLYEFLVSKVPFPAESAGEIMEQKIHSKFIPASRINPNLPEWVDELFLRLLAPSPFDRVQGCQELKTLLSTNTRLKPLKKMASFHNCLNCGEALWKELPFCSHCGMLYSLDVTSGKFGVIAYNVENPEAFLQKIQHLTDKSVPWWRVPLFKSCYPRVFLTGVEKNSASLIADAFTDDNSSMSVSRTPYGTILRHLKFSLPQILLLAFSILLLVGGLGLLMIDTTRGQKVIYPSLFAIAISCGYMIVPMISRMEFKNIIPNRTWPALQVFKKKLSENKNRRIQNKASILIRRIVLLYDYIEGNNLSQSVKQSIFNHLEKLAITGLNQLKQMDHHIDSIKNIGQKGISKKIAALESSLRSTNDAAMIEEIIQRISELTKIQAHYINITQQQAKDESSFSQILSSVNALLLYSQLDKLDEFQDKIIYAMES